MSTRPWSGTRGSSLPQGSVELRASVLTVMFTSPAGANMDFSPQGDPRLEHSPLGLGWGWLDWAGGPQEGWEWSKGEVPMGFLPSLPTLLHSLRGSLGSRVGWWQLCTQAGGSHTPLEGFGFICTDTAPVVVPCAW